MLVAFSIVISQCTCLPVKAVHGALSLMCLSSSKVLHREVSWKRGRADDKGFDFLPSATAAPILLTSFFFSTTAKILIRSCVRIQEAFQCLKTKDVPGGSSLWQMAATQVMIHTGRCLGNNWPQKFWSLGWNCPKRQLKDRAVKTKHSYKAPVGFLCISTDPFR